MADYKKELKFRLCTITILGYGGDENPAGMYMPPHIVLDNSEAFSSF